MRAVILAVCVLCIARGRADAERGTSGERQRSPLTALEEKLETKYHEYVIRATKWLESVNDRRLGGSELGRLLHYDEIKPRLDEGWNQERGMKKAALGMMPLVFHVGATSTWMLITSLMAAKSVAVGIVLLVFKIAVSSAKVASFFTALKGKQQDHHHHDWSWSHHDHHGYERSLSAGEAVAHSDWAAHWGRESQYRTLPQDDRELVEHVEHVEHGEHGEHVEHGGRGEPPNAETQTHHT